MRGAEGKKKWQAGCDTLLRHAPQDDELWSSRAQGQSSGDDGASASSSA